MSEITLAAHAALAESSDTATRVLCKIALGELTETSETVAAWLTWRESLYKLARQEASGDAIPPEPSSPLTETPS